MQPDHRQAPAGGDRPADDADGHQDRQRPRARSATRSKKIAYKAAQTRGSDRLTRVRYYDVARAAGQCAGDAAAGARRVRAARRRRPRRRSSTDDEEIDAAFLAILRQLISYMMEDPRTITPALEIVFIAKSIERIGDHAKNIAEAVVQVVKGKDVRHASAEQIRAEVRAERAR